MTEEATAEPDITTLMNRNVLELTDDDIDKIIDIFRKKRHAFKTMPAGGTTAPSKKTKGQEVASKLNLDIQL